MNPIETLFKVLSLLLEALGPAVVRRHIDEWEAARVASNAAFTAKFGEKP